MERSMAIVSLPSAEMVMVGLITSTEKSARLVSFCLPLGMRVPDQTMK